MNQRLPLPKAKTRVGPAILIKNNKRRSMREPAPPDVIDPRPPAPLPSPLARLSRIARVSSMLLLFAPLALGLCYLVSVRLSVTRAAIALSAASRAQDKLLQENRELRVERASLRAPARLAEQATAELMMSIPEPQRVIVLDQSGEEILPLPPVPEAPEYSGGHPVE